MIEESVTMLPQGNYDNEVSAIASSDFEDILSFLGPQSVAANITQVRVFKPAASDIDLQLKGKQLSFIRYKQSDLFTVDVASDLLKHGYSLNACYDGTWYSQDDPYYFGKTLDSLPLYLFNQGDLLQGYEHLGAHLITIDGVQGVRFAVWAPNAKTVSVVGDFNNWDARHHIMAKHDCGIWELFIPQVEKASLYKFSILTPMGDRFEKSDPYAAQLEAPPATASIVAKQPEKRLFKSAGNNVDQAISIYEVHAGSWKRVPEEGNRYLSYRELAEQLIPYVKDMGFTHIQLMPVSEFPFDGSWGYQPVGMFSPTHRFGSADDFAYFVDQVKAAGLGILIDWVPGHFPTDAHGLACFDGSHLYEHADKRQGFHPDWNTCIFNYDRAEVKSYLLSSAAYWLDVYGIDGLRVDAVASMLYLDYSREDGQWIPNQYGGRENLGAIELLQQINTELYSRYPGCMMVAEESTAWPGVTKMTSDNGLGFGYKWNMGWMNDSLAYMSQDPIHRKYHHNAMTFSMVYAFDENFILPLSHDEVVHGKGSLLDRMPGDEWQKFANLRAYYGFMWGHPGKKLLFMGCEFAQPQEWDHDNSLSWHVLEHNNHSGIQRWVKQLNHFYQRTGALHQTDNNHCGFDWLSAHNSDDSVFSFVRFDKARTSHVVVIANMTPAVRDGFRLGVPESGVYKVVLNSDDVEYAGSGYLKCVELITSNTAWDGQGHSVEVDLPPLATLFLEKIQ